MSKFLNFFAKLKKKNTILLKNRTRSLKDYLKDSMLRGYEVAVALRSRDWTTRPRCGLPITEYHDREVQAGFLRKTLTVSTIASIKAVKIAPETLLLKRAARRATADTVPVDKAVITFINCNGHTVGDKSIFPKNRVEEIDTFTTMSAIFFTYFFY